MGVELMSGELRRRLLRWSSIGRSKFIDPGLDHKAEYDHLVLFSSEIRDGGQREKVAARSYQGRRGLQRGTPQVIS